MDDTSPLGSPPDSPLAGPVQPGDRFQRPFAVTEAMLTHHVPGAPGLLSTPDLIGQLEDVAAEVLRPRFTAGCASVGTWIGVRHSGAAGLGENVDVVATVSSVDGRRILFDVLAMVGDRRIGHGQVEQTILRWRAG